MNDKKLISILNSLFALTHIPLWVVTEAGIVLYSDAASDAVFTPDFTAHTFTFAIASSKDNSCPFFLTEPSGESYACVFYPPLQSCVFFGPVVCHAALNQNPELSSVPFSKLCHLVSLFCTSLELPCADAEQLYVANNQTEDSFSHMDFSSFLYSQREKIVPHDGYNREQLFLNYIKRGDYENLKLILHSLIQHSSPSTLSDNEREQALFNLIACTTLVTRYAIEGGLNKSLAYNLSDYYIRKAKKCTQMKEIKELLFSMALDFATRVSSTRLNGTCSLPVAKACEYIFSNLHYNISLKDIACAVNRSEGYLSTLFKKETGMTIMEFIRKERLKEACSLLCHTSMSCQEIAASLSFSSQSYFSELFRAEMGVTPSEYRSRHKSY